MFTSIFILILFLPVACLPLVLEIFFSDSDLDEIGICLESPDNIYLMQGYELVGFLSVPPKCDNK